MRLNHREGVEARPTSGSTKRRRRLEARVGIEPTHKGFADLSLTTWVPRPEIKVSPESGIVYRFSGDSLPQQNALLGRAPVQYLERETGFEPATSTLARSHSTAELLPLGLVIINDRL